jgi:hypothetical protein
MSPDAGRPVSIIIVTALREEGITGVHTEAKRVPTRTVTRVR